MRSYKEPPQPTISLDDAAYLSPPEHSNHSIKSYS